MKLIDCFAHGAQGFAQFRFFLSLGRYLDEGNCSESQDTEHRDRDHQLDQREAAYATSARHSWFRFSAHLRNYQLTSHGHRGASQLWIGLSKRGDSYSMFGRDFPEVVSL